MEPGLSHILVGVGVAALTGAFFSAVLVSLRLLRMTEWRQASLRPTWRKARGLFLQYMACEAAYVALAAVAVLAVGPTRPVNFDVMGERHQFLTWVGFGAIMTLFGTRLVSGAVEKLFPELDESAAKQEERWRDRMEIRAGEFITARRTLLRRIVDIHFRENVGPLEDERSQLRDPLVWAIDTGFLKYDRIEARFKLYLEFTGLGSPRFYEELLEQVKRGGVEEEEYAVTMVDKILLNGHGVALQRLAEDCRYLQLTQLPDGPDAQEGTTWR